MGLLNFRYPKLIGLLGAIILAYLLFRNPEVNAYFGSLGNLGYFGILIAGMLFAFGFTAPFAVGFFLLLHPQNLWLTGIVGGIGAAISNALIFRFVRVSFRSEFLRLKRTSFVRRAEKLIEKEFGKRIQLYLMYALVGLIIASPLPDEAGMIMLVGLTKVKLWIVMKLTFILSTLGIIVLLAL